MQRGWSRGRSKSKWGLLAVLTVVAAFAVPDVASAACAPASNGPHTYDYDASQNFSGTFPAARQGDFVQIPFDVPAGTTGIRIHYCYSSTASGSTIDMGLYEPLHPGDTVPGVPERRGWSGSAVKDLAISKNGFSSPATYESARKALVEGRTTRAYSPGSIPEGSWTAELGLASIPADTEWAVEVETSSDPGWADDPYTPAPLSDAVSDPNPGWYAGDVHPHGEEEPGNALMKTSFDYAFAPLSQGGAGLDFLGLVEHNNDVSRTEIGRYQGDYPDKLIIPGTEVTTYRGHYNAIGSSDFADFRGGDVYRWDPSASGGAGALESTPVKPPVIPATQFPKIDASGGWSQINHPSIFQAAPQFCRGCFWNYSDAETDYSKVDAVELQTGPADIGTAPNPFTPDAISFYENRLAAGDHLAAVGTSDSHKADQTDVTTAPIGRASTVVRASELSKEAIVQGVKEAHTYVKLYGNDGPDIRVTAHSAGAPDAIIGDTLKGPKAKFDVTVTGAGPAATRPGTYEVDLLKNGASFDQATVSGDDFSKTFSARGTGRYSIEVLRSSAGPEGTPPRIEVYSSPVWFKRGSNLRIRKVAHNKRRGRARVAVRVGGSGKLALTGSGLQTFTKRAKKAGRRTLGVIPRGKLARELRRRGKVTTTAEVRFAPGDGDAATVRKKITLKRKQGRGGYHR